MKKPIDFATFKKIQKMSFNEFNSWIISIGSTLFEDGVNAVLADCEVVLTEDRLFDILLSIDGIEEECANEIIDKILQEGMQYYGVET